MANHDQLRRAASRIGVPLACYSLSSLLALAAVWVGVARLPPGDAEPHDHRTLLEAMLNWDGGWYKSVAERGYYYQPHQNSNVAFFPAYPLAGLDLAMLTGLSLNAALVAVSHLCFAAALVLLSAYCRQRWPALPRLGWFAVLACALFPAGCFFRMAYSESCFLLLSLVAFYGLQRRWPLAVTAGVIGLATAARPTGVALLAPLALHVWRNQSPAAKQKSGIKNPKSRLSRLLALAVWLPVGCWGLAAYMAYQRLAFGSALAFVDSQMSWHTRPLVPGREKWFAVATLEPIRAVYTAASPVYWGRFDRHWALSWQFANPLFFLAAWGLVAVGWRRRWLSSGEASFSALMLLIPYVSRGYEMGMCSTARFVSVVFPVYIVLGHLLARAPRWAAFLVLLAMATYLAIFSALFAARYFVF